MKFFALLIGFSLLSATEELPWIDRTLAPIFSIKAYGSSFDHLNSNGKKISYRGRTIGVNGSFFVAPWSDISGEIELFTARTHERSFSVDAVKETVRYLLLEDGLGDPFALSIGLSLTQVFDRGYKDLSLIYQGLFLTELHSAQGIEICCTPEIQSRLFALEAFGVSGDSPWLRGRFGVDLSSLCGHRIACLLEGLYGFGSHRLCPEHFQGYGALAYRTLDLKLEYSYRTDSWIYYSIAFDYCLYARNAPGRALSLYTSVSF